MKTLGILKADKVHPDLAPIYGEYPAMFAHVFRTFLPDLVVKVYDVMAGEYPKNLDEVDAFLITGSATSVYEDQVWIRKLGAFVQHLHQQRKKLIGICFGHQLIAHFLGGKTKKSEKGWGIGIYPINLTTAGQLFFPQQDALHLFYSHQDQVVLPPKDSKILAGSDFCPISICTIGDHIFTTQCHIEMPLDYGRALFAMRRERFAPAHYQQAMQSLTGRNDTKIMIRRIIDFIWSANRSSLY